MDSIPQMKETVDLRSYAAILWRRKWVFLAPIVLAAVTSLIVTMPRIMRPVYQSSSTLMVELPQSLNKGLASLVDNPSIDEQIMRLQSQIQSNEFLTHIIVNTGLREDDSIRQWAAKNHKRYPDLSIDELVDLKLIEYLRSSVHMSGNGGSRSHGQGQGNLIQVSVADFYPTRARRLVQNITAGIIEANRGEQLRQVKSTGDFSATQLEEYQGKLREAENRLEEYRKGLLKRRVKPTLVREENLSAAKDLRQQASLDLAMQESELAKRKAGLSSAGVNVRNLDALLAARGIAALLEGARLLEQNYAEQTLMEAGPSGAGGQGAAISLARKQDEVASALRDTLTAQGLTPEIRERGIGYLRTMVARDLSRTRINVYDSQLGEWNSQANYLPEADTELKRLQQDVDSYRELQNAFIMQVASSQISAAFGTSKVGEKISILEPAQHPLKPVRPKRGRIIALSVVAGMFLGVVGAFVTDHHDPTFRDVKDAERALGLRVIGTVPNLETLARVAGMGARREDRPLRAAAIERAVDEFLSDSPGYQEFRKLALGLLRLEGGGPRSLMITSARRGEGKTLSSACLALAMAKELPQERIVLVDLDTRKASLGALFGINGDSAENSISLREQVWTGQPFRPLPLPNLVLLPVHASTIRPEDQVTLASVRWLLGQLASQADRILIDAPPNLPVSDPLIIGSAVDAVLMVVRAGVTPRETARRGVELQRQFHDNLVGLIMNNAAEVLPYYYSARHYGYGYTGRG